MSMLDEPSPALAVAIEAGVGLLRAGDGEAALAAFDRVLAVHPEFAIAHYNRGCALELLCRDAAAIHAYRAALALLPELVEAAVRLAGLLLLHGSRAEAVALMREAAEIAADEPVGSLCHAWAELESDRAEVATAALRAAVAQAPDNVELHQMLGVALRERGDFAAAEEALQRSLALHPVQATAWYNLLTLRRVAPADHALLDRLDAMLARTEFGDRHRALLHFARGKAHDDLGEYADAMRHFDAANRLRRRYLTFDRAAFAADIDALIAAFPSGAAGPGVPSDLPVLVVGMMRSGTTLVEQILSSHGRVGGAGELPFWAHAAARLGPPGMRFTFSEAAATGVAYLDELTRAAPGRDRVTDKTPANFLWLGLLRQALPGARFLHCRRDPIDTCLSIYFTDFGTRKDFAYDRGDLVFYWRQYARLMAHWRAVLPPECFLEVEYETLVAAPEPQSRRMIDFCGLDWDPACLHPERNRRTVRTASVWQARQPVHTGSVQRWRNYEPWLGEFAELREAR